MLNMAHFKDDSSPNGASAFLSVIDFSIILIIMFIDYLVVILCFVAQPGIILRGSALMHCFWRKGWNVFVC